MPVTYEQHGPVAAITLDDGKANAVGMAVIEELHAALNRVDADDEVRAVVIAGRTGRFSAGFDLAAMTASHESMKELMMAGGRLVARILTEPRPVVAACTGHALALGGLLLLAADHRIGTQGDFKIGLNEVAIGLPMPRWGVELASYRLAPTELQWRLVLGQTASPDEAVTAGFLDRVVAAEAVVGESLATARRLAELTTTAVGGTKERARRQLVDRMLDGMDADIDTIALPRPG